MGGEKIAKRQKVSHGSEGPSASSKSKTKHVEEEPPAASSDSEDEGSSNEQTETAAEEAPKTFKDLVRILYTRFAVNYI